MMDTKLEIRSLKKRADFLRLRHPAKMGGSQSSSKAFLMVYAPSSLEPAPAFIRVGYTVTKKMGNAVVRNRIKRRLRAAIKEVMPLYAKPGGDYVFIARRKAIDMPFDLLCTEVKRALETSLTTGHKASNS